MTKKKQAKLQRKKSCQSLQGFVGDWPQRGTWKFFDMKRNILYIDCQVVMQLYNFTKFMKLYTYKG